MTSSSTRSPTRASAKGENRRGAKFLRQEAVAQLWGQKKKNSSMRLTRSWSRAMRWAAAGAVAALPSGKSRHESLRKESQGLPSCRRSDGLVCSWLACSTH